MSRPQTPLDRPTLIINDLVLAKLAALQTRSTPGVARLQTGRTRSARATVLSTMSLAQTTDRTDGVSVDTADGAKTIEIRLVVYGDHGALAVAEAVQRRVIAAASEHTGITPTVSLLITDIETEPR